MWGFIVSTCVVLAAVPWLTKLFAHRQLRLCFQQTLASFQDLANTESGTPEELQQMIEELEGMMEEFQGNASKS